MHNDSASGIPYSKAEEPKKERFVQLWTWWKSPASGRKFAVVDKLASGEGSYRKTTQIKLLEVDDSNPFYRDVAEFWALVDAGKLVELTHDAIDTPKDIS